MASMARVSGDIAAWQRIGERVRSRASELLMTQSDIIEQAELSEHTVRPFWQGRPTNARPHTEAAIAAALGWRYDAFERLRAGQEPEQLPPTATVDVRGEINELREALQAALGILIRLERRLSQ